MDRRWLPGQELKPHARYRLFCLPYAGGAAHVYRQWRHLAPAHIQVCAVELPGRGSRSRETPFTRLAPLVKELAVSLEGTLDRPFALFGHSMGGLIAFELARTLREQRAPEPAHLFVSATASPGTPPGKAPVHDVPEADFIQRLRDLNGTPEELLRDEELMALMMPVLRADFALFETYEYREAPPLTVPITAFGGEADTAVSPTALAGWRGQSASGSRLRFFPGGHFFLHSAAADVLGAITHALS
jgi:medium-chain acyl-[acyl-carrier-protein] hydrolase